MADLDPSADAFLSVLRGRRSVRRFRPDPVSEEAIAAMAEAAAWAPSAQNRQPYRLVAVTSPERIRELAEAVRAESDVVKRALPDRIPSAYIDNFLHFQGAPLVFAPFHRAGIDPLRALGIEHPVVGQVELDALSSVAASIQNLLLCAHALGLGACWMTGPLIAGAALARILDVPNGWKVTALIPVGYAAESPAAPRRRPMEQLLRRM